MDTVGSALAWPATLFVNLECIHGDPLVRCTENVELLELLP